MRMNPEDSINHQCPEVVSIDAPSVVVDAPTAISELDGRGQSPNSRKCRITSERRLAFVLCAKRLKNGKVCAGPAMKNRLGAYTRCRRHGGKHKGPVGLQNALKHGRRCRTNKAIASKLDANHGDVLATIAELTADE